MPNPASLRPLAACVVTGVAVWVSRGVLDQTDNASGHLRLALLPSWLALAAFVGLSTLGLMGLAWLSARRRPAATDSRLGDLVLPPLSLIVLVVPFLPVVPDQWPALQALSGPMAGVVWLGVAALQAWVLWQARVVTCDRLGRWPRRRMAAAIFVATAALSTAAAAALTRSAVFPGGDEPHYLVIAQSLWRDGDLKIENNHVRGDYREYFAAPLEPHHLTRGTDGEIYSVHPVGMPVLMAPVYALGGYEGVVAALILAAAAAAAMGWWWAAGALNAPGAATFAWIAVAGTAPFLLNTISVYPEILAGVAVMIALVLSVRADPTQSGLGRWLTVGVACASLPWLSTKYAPMSAALVMVAFGRCWRAPLAAFARDPRLWAVGAPYAASLACWFYFFYAFWGNPLPMAPYGDLVQTSPRNLVFGAPGLLFDQEYGLLAQAPVYVLAATGLFHMWRTGGDLRRQAIELLLVFGALVASVGAFRIWWGGTSAASRPIASGLLLFVLPMAVAFHAAPAGSARRAGQILLLGISAAIAITLTVAQGGLLMDNGRDGTAALLEFWSPRWGLWSLAPTFTFHDTPIAALHTAVWLCVAAAAGVILARWPGRHPGASALAAVAVFGGALMVIALLMPSMPAGATRPPIDLSARSRLAALDGFGARALSTAVLYDPFRTADPAALLPHLSLGVRPSQRTDPQPLRVIHNGRFSLPAGTYAIEVAFGDRAPSGPALFSIQVGRAGPPLKTWTVQPGPGEVWRTEVQLPVDANFVGFRGALDLEQAIEQITITPTAVVDAGERPRVAAVLSATAYPGASVFFHDDHAYPEPQGFWTVGGRTTAVTMAAPPGRNTPVVLRMHSGGQANSASFSATGWRQQVSLTPGQAADVELPPALHGVVALTIETAAGFRPQDPDAASRDARTLGIWVEVVP